MTLGYIMNIYEDSVVPYSMLFIQLFLWVRDFLIKNGATVEIPRLGKSPLAYLATTWAVKNKQTNRQTGVVPATQHALRQRLSE